MNSDKNFIVKNIKCDIAQLWKEHERKMKHPCAVLSSKKRRDNDTHNNTSRYLVTDPNNELTAPTVLLIRFNTDHTENTVAVCIVAFASVRMPT
jgi:hypothetical protein